jgi:hypothetical protein
MNVQLFENFSLLCNTKKEWSCIRYLAASCSFVEPELQYLVILHVYPVSLLKYLARRRSWLQIQRPGVRIPALPDFLTNRGPGTGLLNLVSTIEELPIKKR